MSSCQCIHIYTFEKHRGCLQAEPDFVAQDDGASPMQEDSLRNAAYTDSPPVVQAKAELAVEAQGPSKYSGKRKQQDSSVNKLPR